MKRYIVRLTDEERAFLGGLISKGKGAAYKIRHAHILLKSDADGLAWTDKEIATAFSVNVNTVRNVRQRFVEEGFEAALGRKKLAGPTVPPKLDGEKQARLIALSLSEPPNGYNRWTLHLLAGKLVELRIVESISHETVRQGLKKTG